MPYGYRGVNYNAGASGLQHGAEALAKHFEQKAKDAKAAELAQGTVAGSQHVIALAKQFGVIDDAEEAKIRLMSAPAQAKAIGSLVVGIGAHYKEEQDKRAEANQTRQLDLQDLAEAHAKRAEARDQAVQARVHQSLTEGPPIVWSKEGIPYSVNPVTGETRREDALIPAPPPDPQKRAQELSKQFDDAMTKRGLTPDVLGDTTQQHAAIYNKDTGQFQNASPASGTHIYYGPYLPDTSKDADVKTLGKAMQEANVKRRPPMLTVNDAQYMNNLQSQVTPSVGVSAAQVPTGAAAPQGEFVPGISAVTDTGTPIGPVTYGPAPSGGSAVDTALASAAATQQALGMSPQAPSMGGAGTPFPATAIPTTFRDIPGAGYVPRAVPVDVGSMASRVRQAYPGLGADLPPAPRVTPPTPDQIAQMQAPPAVPAAVAAKIAPAAPVVPAAGATPPPGTYPTAVVPNPPSVAWSTPVPAGPTPAPSPPAQVLMVHPDDGSKLAGKTGYIDAAAVPKALDLGFKPAIEPKLPPTEAESTPPAVPVPPS